MNGEDSLYESKHIYNVKDMEKPSTNCIDEYIAGFEPEVRARMEQLRALVKEIVPGA